MRSKTQEVLAKYSLSNPGCEKKLKIFINTLATNIFWQGLT